MQWDTSLYDGKHSFVTKYGEAVLALLNPQRGERILDVGCGTGHLTSQIAEASAQVVGIDNSKEMIEAARAAHPEIRFEIADAANFSFDETFDAIFSNAALHWVTKMEDAIVCMARVLRHGGRFVIEMGGKGNIAQITAAFKTAMWEEAQIEVEHGRVYPSVAEYSVLLERHGLSVRSAALFDRPTPLADGANGLSNWLRQFNGAALETIPHDRQQAVIENVERRLQSTLFSDGHWIADYRRLRIVAIKE